MPKRLITAPYSSSTNFKTYVINIHNRPKRGEGEGEEEEGDAGMNSRGKPFLVKAIRPSNGSAGGSN